MASLAGDSEDYITAMKIEIPNLKEFFPFRCCLPQCVTDWLHFKDFQDSSNQKHRKGLLNLFLIFQQNADLFQIFGNAIEDVYNGDMPLWKMLDREYANNYDDLNELRSQRFQMLAIWTTLVFWQLHIKDNLCSDGYHNYKCQTATHQEGCFKFVPPVAVRKIQIRKKDPVLKDDTPVFGPFGPDNNLSDVVPTDNTPAQLEIWMHTINILKLFTHFHELWRRLTPDNQRKIHQSISQDIKMSSRLIGCIFNE